MRQLSLAIALAALPVSASARAGKGETAATAYEDARRAFYLLKANPAARGREPWLHAAERFEQVARQFPRAEQAPQALYTAAELRSQLARISLAAIDRQAALADYDKVSRGYPESPLADDALFALARSALDREDAPEKAREILDDLLHRYPKGDMAHRAHALRQSLPAAPEGGRLAERAAPRGEDKPVKSQSRKPRKESVPAAEEPANAEAEDGAPTDTPPKGSDASDEDAPTVAEALPAGLDESPQGPVTTAVKHGPSATAGRTTDPPPTETAPKRSSAQSHPLLEALRRVGSAPGGIPLAVQMGLKVHRVVIDAGHGGHDSGAVGPAGTKEKDVTLAVARKLAIELRAQGLEVLLSRDDDRYVGLEERAKFANGVKADLFISVHCNAARDRQLRGTETYFLNVTDDRYAMKLAARENQASEKSLSDLQLILADMATKADVEESARLAEEVQAALTDGTRDPGRRDLGVKHALFYVLLGTHMPSVLVETGFLSNREDEQKLATDRVQSELAHDIAHGVAGFLSQRQGLAELVP